MTVEKPKPKQLLRPITTGTNSAANQSQFLAITCNSLEAREKSPVYGAIGFGFASYWLKNWRESFKPITKRSNRNHVITFDSHLKTSLPFWNTPTKYKYMSRSDLDYFVRVFSYFCQCMCIKFFEIVTDPTFHLNYYPCRLPKSCGPNHFFHRFGPNFSVV